MPSTPRCINGSVLFRTFFSVMESDSDSDASHVSATPPRISNPVPPKKEIRVPPSKRNPKPKPFAPILPQFKIRSAFKHADPPAADFPSADLSNPHGLSVVNIRRSANFPNHATSFSRLVMSRRPSFDPSEFQIGGRTEHCDQIDDGSGGEVAYWEDSAELKRLRPALAKFDGPVERLKPSECSTEVGDVTGCSTGGRSFLKEQVKPKRVHPNWVGLDSSVELPTRPKCSREGNFVRLNLNGRGRKFSFKNGNRRSYNSSRGRKYRRRLVAGKSETAVEEDFVSDCLFEQRKSSNCSNQLLEEAVLAAREDPSEENLKRLLKFTHGYDTFREGQLEAIKRVVSGESTLLILPTGGGKSLCYELPALLLTGVTVVVSPLVALMIDQLRKLPSVIPGGLLSSAQTSDEASETVRKLHEGIIKVLFVSPERFLNINFLSIFGDGLQLSLLVIDEAHCISEWSHNFRPSYLRLKSSILQRKLSVQCILAMTATATIQTSHDIMDALEIQPINIINICRVRENLQHFVTLSENRLKDLLLLMKASPLVEMHSIIVYCKFQNETDLVSKYLSDNNIPAMAYHSGIPAKTRGHIQQLFCSNKIRVVVATVAFGMGLDKSDVRAVIHYSMPESLEEYIQETGRAGRDGNLSYCHLLLYISTYYKLRSLAYSDGVDEYAISKFLSHVFSDVHLPGKISSLVKESMTKKFDLKEEAAFSNQRICDAFYLIVAVYNACILSRHIQVLLTILTELEISDEKYLIQLSPVNVTCSLYFHKTSPTLLSDKDILIASILKKSEVKGGHYVFDIPTVANDVGVRTADLLNKLQILKASGEVTYDLKDPAFCYTIVKKPDDMCSLSANVTGRLSQFEICKVKKIDAMFNVAWSAVKDCKDMNGCSNSLHTACIQRKISYYFSGRHDVLNDDVSFNMARSRPFLRADIKVFLQSNSYTHFTPRAVARIMHGLPSPAFPSSTWSKSHFWGRYVELDFAVVMEAAKAELMNFVGKHEH